MKPVLLLPLLLLLLISGCATHLTEAGKRITVVRDSNSALIKHCKQLDSVTGVPGSFLSGGEYGVIYATKDARNKTGAIPSADTLLITNNEPKRFGGEVTGIAYNCSAPKMLPVQAPQQPGADPRGAAKKNAETSSGKNDGKIFEKARKCQSKGGVWVNDVCVIDVD